MPPSTQIWTRDLDLPKKHHIQGDRIGHIQVDHRGAQRRNAGAYRVGLERLHGGRGLQESRRGRCKGERRHPEGCGQRADQGRE